MGGAAVKAREGVSLKAGAPEEFENRLPSPAAVLTPRAARLLLRIVRDAAEHNGEREAA